MKTNQLKWFCFVCWISLLFSICLTETINQSIYLNEQNQQLIKKMEVMERLVMENQRTTNQMKVFRLDTFIKQLGSQINMILNENSDEGIRKRLYDSYLKMVEMKERRKQIGQTLEWSLETIEIDRRRSEAYQEIDKLIYKIEEVDISESTNCFGSKLNRNLYHQVSKWTLEHLRALSTEGAPDWLLEMDEEQRECFINNTFTLGQFPTNYAHQARIYSMMGKYERSKDLLNTAMALYPSQYMHLNLIRATSNLVYLASDKEKEAIEFINSLDISYKSDRILTHTKIIAESRIYTVNTQPGLIHFNQLKMESWLQEKPRSGCEREIIINWFDHPKANITLIQDSRSQTNKYGTNEPAKYLRMTERMEEYSRMNLSFVDRSAFVVRIDNAIVRSQMEIQTECIYSFFSLSAYKFQMDRKRKFRKVNRIAVFGSLVNSYYHEVIEGMSRLIVLKKMIFDVPQYSDVKLLIEYNHLIDKLLDWVGFDKSRILIYDRNYLYNAKSVFVADWTRDYNANDQILHSINPPAWLLRILRDSYISYAINHHIIPFDTSISQSNNKKVILYVSRDFTDTVRFVENEEWLIYNIRSMINNKYRNSWKLLIHTGNEELEEQVKKFRRADIVIGPHGAGLSNMIFCQSNTSIVEFPLVNPSHINYAVRASALELDYWIIPDMYSTYQGFYQLNRSRIEAILDTIDHLIRSKPRL